MKSFLDKLKQVFSNNWAVAALILAVFLLTNRYIFGWDDQHLEIPLLKHLIDPTLYKGDYYVESLKENFTSFLYPILSRFLKVDQIPTVYLALYCISRYVFFYWIFRLWAFIAKGDRAAAILCTLATFLLGRTEEFLYRTFSHQEFSFIFIFAGLYFFYRGRFLIAALIFGAAANFHAIYSLFPMMYLSAFIVLFQKDRKWPLFFKTASVFVAAAAPFIIWTILRAVKTRLHADPHLYDNWMELYLLSCPQNFIFETTPLKEALSHAGTFYTGVQNYIFLAVLYLFHVVCNEDFRRDIKAHAVALMVVLLTAATFVFTYVWPSHFVLDLNLVRNEQYLRFLLVGYTVLMAWKWADGPIWKALLVGALLTQLNGKSMSDIVTFSLIGAVLVISRLVSLPQERKNIWLWMSGGLFIILTLGFLAPLLSGFPASFGMGMANPDPGIGEVLKSFLMAPRGGRVMWALILMGVLAWGLSVMRKAGWEKPGIAKALAVIPFATAIIFYVILHVSFVKISTQGGGFWQLQRNWEDMQFYVRDHTPKDALIMAPNDMEMGGFRIHSNRKILTDYRDCGIIGFDIAATVEWRKRMLDIDAFKVIIKEPFTDALKNGIVKYQADYIVFMRYAAPQGVPFLTKMYENEAFTLYRVNRTN